MRSLNAFKRQSDMSVHLALMFLATALIKGPAPRRDGREDEKARGTVLHARRTVLDACLKLLVPKPTDAYSQSYTSLLEDFGPMTPSYSTSEYTSSGFSSESV